MVIFLNILVALACYFAVASAYDSRKSNSGLNVFANDAVKVIVRPFLNWFVPGSGRWIGHLTYPPDWCRANGVEAISNLLLYHPDLTSDEEITILQMLHEVQENQGDSFFESAEYFDDVLWWSLAYTRAYEVALKFQSVSTIESNKFLAIAMKINDVVTKDSCERDNVCGEHACYWSRTSTYKNAITNELYMTSSARLARLATTSEIREKYLQRAENSIKWFLKSGMLNASTNLVVDGLSSTCEPTGNVYTYNQGVLLGGFSEYALLQPDVAESLSLWSIARNIIDAATTKLVDPLTHVLTESSCGDALFKGIFTRYLRYFLTSSSDVPLDTISPTQRQNWEMFLQTQVQSIWYHARDSLRQTDYVTKSWNIIDYNEEADALSGLHTIYHNAQISAIDGITSAIITRSNSSEVTEEACSGHGYLIHEQADESTTASCTCFARYAGEHCSKEEISWVQFYANSSITFSGSYGDVAMGKLLCLENPSDTSTRATACLADDDLSTKATFIVEPLMGNIARFRAASSFSFLSVAKAESVGKSEDNFLVQTSTVQSPDTLFEVKSYTLSSKWKLEEISLYSVAHKVFLAMVKDEITGKVRVSVASHDEQEQSTAHNRIITFIANNLQNCVEN